MDLRHIMFIMLLPSSVFDHKHEMEPTQRKKNEGRFSVAKGNLQKGLKEHPRDGFSATPSYQVSHPEKSMITRKNVNVSKRESIL